MWAWSPRGEGGRPPNPNPRAAGLGATPPLAAGPRRGWGAPPLASYIRRGKGRGAAPFWLPIANPSRPPLLPPPPPLAPPLPEGYRNLHPLAASPLAVGLLCHLLVLFLLPWLRRSHARGDLHHQRHHNHRGVEIYLATPSLLAGSRRRSLHRAVDRKSVV